MREETKVKLLKYVSKKLDSFLDGIIVGGGWGLGFMLILFWVGKNGGGQ